MFAIVSNDKNINVYNFYTYECTERMMFSGHNQRTMSIDWFTNDMGFTTAGGDPNIFFYDLYGNDVTGG